MSLQTYTDWIHDWCGHEQISVHIWRFFFTCLQIWLLTHWLRYATLCSTLANNSATIIAPGTCFYLDIKESILKITISICCPLSHILWPVKQQTVWQAPAFPKRAFLRVCKTCQFKMCFDNSLLSLLSPCCSDTVNLAPSLSFFVFCLLYINVCVGVLVCVIQFMHSGSNLLFYYLPVAWTKCQVCLFAVCFYSFVCVSEWACESHDPCCLMVFLFCSLVLSVQSAFLSLPLSLPPQFLIPKTKREE